MGYYNLYKKPITLSVSVSNVDAVTEVLRCCKDSKFGKVCVLNSAHFTKPGGGFSDGSISQEATLCAESTLYNVLSHFGPTYYERSKKAINKHMYANQALYIPNVIFSRGAEAVKCDVVFCSAPNMRTALKHRTVTIPEINKVQLENRIAYIMDVAARHCVDTLILTPFGCDTCGQDPTVVAKTFDHFLCKYRYGFTYVIFAVGGADSNLYNVFQKYVLNKQ